MLKGVVRSAEFIDGPAIFVEEDSSSQRLSVEASGCNKAIAAMKHMLGNIFKKAKRLGRKSVPAPRKAVQSVKGLNRLKCVGKINPDFGLFGFADTASDRAIQAFENGFMAGFEITPTQVWSGSKNKRGYEIKKLEPVFERYLTDTSTPQNARVLDPLADNELRGIQSARPDSL